MEKRNNYMTDVPPLRTFAHLGNFMQKLKYLSTLAEKENWYYNAPNAKDADQRRFGVLFQYIHHTFSKAQDDKKIITTDTNAIFNTGLLTPNGEEIFALFAKNRIEGAQQEWFLTSFYRTSAHEIPENLRGGLPSHVDYFEGHPEDMYFNTTLPILANMDHIIEDKFERLPEAVKGYDIEMVKLLINNAGEIMRKKITRNNRLVVPQYYNKKIMYLAPLTVGGNMIPLAIEKFEQSYRINTIFTPGMAYCNARLITKPESNWLINIAGLDDDGMESENVFKNV